MLEEGVTEPSGLKDETECPVDHSGLVRVDDDGNGIVEPCYVCRAVV